MNRLAWPLAAAFFLSCSGQPPAQEASALTLPGLSGQNVSLSDFPGSVVLIDFWATWCEPCREELPDLLKLHEEFKDKGFTVLGVSMDAGDKETVEEYVQKNRVSYPILLSGGQPVSGYRILGLPTAFLIDRQGRIIKRYLGPKSFSEMSADVKPLLKAPFNQ